MQENIAEYLPKPHPTKAIFVRSHIPAAAVAQYLGLSTSYVCSLLNGFARVSPDNDVRHR